jgi:hypothetical protein
MHALYSFDFLDTISKQLRERLDALGITTLCERALLELESFQNEHGRTQGVYVVYYGGLPKYVGKAENLASRLGQHHRKLTGRRRIDPAGIGYKCLVLDGSMSTAANEKLLIAQFRKDNPDMWNGAGFGPNDPGKHRDTTKPSAFDEAHPIRVDIRLEDIADALTLGELAEIMKRKLPYVFRYDLEDRAESLVDLSGVERTPYHLLRAMINCLGTGWRGAILSYGMVFYRNRKHYPHGEEIDPAT